MTNRKINTLCIIQARETSTRFPRKVYALFKGRSLISCVCKAARDSKMFDKVVVAWAHKFPHLDENDVYGRFVEVINKYQPKTIVRLTSDCPMLTPEDIQEALHIYHKYGGWYYYNGIDGKDVQVISPTAFEYFKDREHVIKPFLRSVNTPEDLALLNSLSIGA